jgi:hypothetical protein
MDTKLTRLVLKIRRYKKLALLGFTCIIVSLCLVVTGLLFLSSANLWSGDTVRQATHSVTNTVSPMLSATPINPGILEKTMLAAASNYLQLTMQQGELRQHAAALSCFASLGGPSPSEVLAAVELKVSSPDVTATGANFRHGA